MAALHLATSVLSRGDQLPDKPLDVLVPIVGVEAVEEGEADGILVMKARLVVVWLIKHSGPEATYWVVCIAMFGACVPTLR